MSKTERRYTSARERAEKQSAGFTSPYLKLPSGASMFKPKTGTMLIDILPFVVGRGNPWAEKGALHWERTIYVHRGIGANGDSYLCPRMTSKQPCPVCEFRAHLVKQGKEDHEELIRDLSPKQRNLYNVINLKEPDKGVQIWDISYHLFGKVLDARLRNADEDDGWERFFFLEDGFTLKVSFAEKSFGGNSYNEAETIDFKPRREDYGDDILETVHRLDGILVEEEYDKLKKIFLEAASEGKKKSKDEDEDDDAPPKRKSAPVDDDDDEPPKKKAKPSDDDDDDDDVPPPSKKNKSPSGKKDWDDFDKKGDADDDDEEPPKKKSKVVDEDDDEEPPKRKSKPAEDDDDEEPAPKRKSKPADDDDDEEPAPKRRAADDDDDDEEPAPKRKAAPADDDDDEEPTPKKKPKPADDDDDEEPAPKKKSKSDDDDDDDGWDKVKKKDKPPVDDDDDEEEKPRVKAGSDDDDDEDEPPRKKK